MRWQDDEAFVAWLIAQEYARREAGKLYLCMAGGIYLYMYESWCGAKETLLPKREQGIQTGLKQ